MPVYCYVCRNCDHRVERLLPVDGRNDPHTCPACSLGDHSVNMVRDLHAEQVHSTDQEYHTPVYSSSLGINPAQIPEALRTFPHHEYAPDGRMILRSHAQRKRVMKELGFHDKDGY